MGDTMADHDPEAFAEKLRYWKERGAPGQLKHQGTTNTRVVQREDRAGVAGYQVDHWNGRVDGIATPQTEHYKMKREQ